MLRERSATLVQIGVGLIVIGLAINVALWLGLVLRPLAGIAIFAGIVLAIIGALSPGRRY